jgi:hypothetical protein
MAPSSPPALEADLRRLTLQTLAACWLAQVLLAGLFHQWLPIPVRPLLMDRGGCGAAQWRDLLRRYGDLHLQDRLGRERYSPVIETSVFGERFSLRPPDPQRLAAAPTVGVRERSRLAVLRDRYPKALVLSCQSTDPLPTATSSSPE